MRDITRIRISVVAIIFHEQNRNALSSCRRAGRETKPESRGEIKRDSTGKYHADEVLMLKHDRAAGRWVFTNPRDATDCGSIIKFVQSRDGINIG